MTTPQTTTAQHLYALYDTLPDEVQRAFLEELLQKKSQELEELAFALACQQAKAENDFLREKRETIALANHSANTIEDWLSDKEDEIWI